MDLDTSGPFGFGDTSGCCNANPGGGLVLGVLISNRLRFARISDTAFNHYSMLATIQESWHLGCLGNTCDHKHVKPMRALAGPPGCSRLLSQKKATEYPWPLPFEIRG